MALRLSNTGTAAQLFADFQTVMGTTLGWALFDDVSATDKVFTLPANAGQGPAFVEVIHDTVGFGVSLRIWQSWDAPSDTGTGDAPNVVDSNTVNRYDFTTAVETKSYRIYGGSRYVAFSGEGAASNITGMWAGLITTLATAAQYAVPVGFIGQPGTSSLYKGYWRSDAGVGFSNLNHNPFAMGNWASTIETSSGKVPAMTAFFFGGGGLTQIPGSADDILHIPAAANFDDVLTIGGDTYRVTGGGLMAFKVN